MRRFHEAMESAAGVLDGAENGIRVMTEQRNEYEAAMYDRYGDPDDYR